MTRINLACAAVWFASFALAGCNGSGGNAGREGSAQEVATVTGSVTYLQRTALPPEAEVRVVLEDVSLQDVPAVTLAADTVLAQGKQVPVPFSISYHPGQVDETHTYSLRAEIWIGGERRFTSMEAFPVITRGAPDHADITVMALEKPRATMLVGTYWKLLSVGGMNALPAADARREPHLTLLEEDHRAVATGGCNQMSGTYQMSDQGLTFSPFVSTRMACPGVMEQEGALGRAFSATRGYRIQDDTLELTDETGAVLARFVAATQEDD